MNPSMADSFLREENGGERKKWREKKGLEKRKLFIRISHHDG